MNVRRALQVSALPVLMLLLFCANVAGCFFLTGWIYSAVGLAPPAVLIQIVNGALGALITVLMMAGIVTFISTRTSARRRWMGIAEPIVEALERISRGDFQVRVEVPALGANTLVSELAISVNQVAIELNQMEHLRQEFISDVSHEIQSPLTSIRGFAQTLHDEHLSAEERNRYLAIIEAESMRLSKMTDNMLKLASLESEYMRLEAKPYRLDKQLRALLLACEPQWASKALEIDAALEDLVICGDEDLLGQVWSNVLHNSIKFTPAGGKISVTAHRCGEVVECAIADSGIGISEDALAHIFQRFYKADKARERSREGSGLGLAIASKIVDLHHGSIGVTSQPGLGTTLTITLPIEPTIPSE